MSQIGNPESQTKETPNSQPPEQSVPPHLNRKQPVIFHQTGTEEAVSCRNILVTIQNDPLQSEQPASELQDGIWLNKLVYDKRSIQELPSHTVVLPALFQPNPCAQMKHMGESIGCILMSTFGYESETLLPIVASGIKLILINQRQQTPSEGSVKRNFLGKGQSVLIEPPSRQSQGVFHSKVWLIRFKSGALRVVVGTANLHLADWSVWQNACWFQDFPAHLSLTKHSTQSKTTNLQSKQPAVCEAKDKNSQTSNNVEKQKTFNFGSDFQLTLMDVIESMLPKQFDFAKQFGAKIGQFDFSKAKGILIPSLPGTHKHPNPGIKKAGLAKLRNILMLYGPKHKSVPTLTYNSTSLGRVDDYFLRSLYFSFAPHAPTFEIEKIKLVYPSKDYVDNESCGASQPLFLQRSLLNASPLLSKVLHRYVPNLSKGVKGTIPHLKTAIVEYEEDPNKCVLLLGSHNMTKAAWGTFSKGESEITCNNSELGVLFLDYNKSELLRWLPYQYPAEPYRKDEQPFTK